MYDPSYYTDKATSSGNVATAQMFATLALAAANEKLARAQLELSETNKKAEENAERRHRELLDALSRNTTKRELQQH